MHTTSRTISGFAGIALGAALVALCTPQLLFAEEPKGAAPGEPTLAAPADKKPCPCAPESNAAERLPLPYSCPKFPLMTFDTYDFYQSERHAEAGCQVPEIDYVYGNYTWPQDCPSCTVPGYCDPDSDIAGQPGCKYEDIGKGFFGLPYKIPHDHDFLLPVDRVRKNSLELDFPEGFNRFLKFKDIDGDTRVVKVFKFRVDLGLASDPVAASNPITTHFALECQTPTVEPAEITGVNRVPLTDPRHPDIQKCYVYRVRYQNVQILTLIEGD